MSSADPAIRSLVRPGPGPVLAAANPALAVVGGVVRGRIAVVAVTLLGATALLLPLLPLHDPTFIDPAMRLQPPSTAHLLGTDHLGRDVLSRVLAGARVSLAVGLAVALASGVIGTAIGLVAGIGRRWDEPLMRSLDGLMAFPGVVLGIAVVLQLGPRFHSVVIALTCVYAPGTARLARSAALVVREAPYFEAARATGCTTWRLLSRHALPNIVPSVAIHVAFIGGAAILAEASLSFLGAGIDPRVPTWGGMLRDGQRLLAQAWWPVAAPGLALLLAVAGFFGVSERLRTALDPGVRWRRRERADAPAPGISGR